jgi:hypothetical protein
MADPVTLQHIEQLRGSLADKLGELHRRASELKQRLTPSSYWRNPWVRFAAGATIGFVLAGNRRSQRGHEGIIHAMVRAGLSAAVGAIVTRSLALPPGDAPPG